MSIVVKIRVALLAMSFVGAAAALSGCAVEGGGVYGPDVDVGVGFDYYDSPGYYGGWGGGYRVGPGRGGHWDHDHDRGHGGVTHSYRAAPSGRSMPSIPSRAHGGGSRGGSHH